MFIFDFFNKPTLASMTFHDIDEINEDKICTQTGFLQNRLIYQIDGTETGPGVRVYGDFAANFFMQFCFWKNIERVWIKGEWHWIDVKSVAEQLSSTHILTQKLAQTIVNLKKAEVIATEAFIYSKIPELIVEEEVKEIFLSNEGLFKYFFRRDPSLFREMVNNLSISLLLRRFTYDDFELAVKIIPWMVDFIYKDENFMGKLKKEGDRDVKLNKNVIPLAERSCVDRFSVGLSLDLRSTTSTGLNRCLLIVSRFKHLLPEEREESIKKLTFVKAYISGEIPEECESTRLKLMNISEIPGLVPDVVGVLRRIFLDKFLSDWNHSVAENARRAAI